MAIDWKSGSPATAVDPADSTVPAAGTAMPADSPQPSASGGAAGSAGAKDVVAADAEMPEATSTSVTPTANALVHLLDDLPLPDDGPHLVDGALRIAARTERNRELNRCDMAEPSPSGRHALASGVSGVLMVNNIDRCHSLMSDQGQASPTNEREFAARKPPN